MNKRGLGYVMAQVSMDQLKSRIEKGEAVLCPICETEMEHNGVAYFCYAYIERGHTTIHHPCVTSTHKYVYEAFFEAHDYLGAVDDWQGTILAAVVDDSGDNPVILAELRTVRGPNGKTNMSASINLETNYTNAELPKLIKKFGWTFMDWVPLTPEN